MARDMGSKGHKQGDMSPKVDEIAKPRSSFSQEGFSKTLDYVERKDAHENRSAKDVEKQAYKGRYS